ncbi:MAG: WecB/TagA/CpsF family glycosyltransferase [Rikenellaceae bacterium]|jgi:N-acetylglucosaminyldiphosphoundecaprenol N-acetyl-beta-D-mannosaminyltransferase|nr:WecB/TagA/CpsF family glycosyltransferase [Rikenellaceae bacterium]
MTTQQIGEYRVATALPEFDFGANAPRGYVIACINAHSWVVARRDRAFRRALKSSDLLLPDGEGIVLAAKMLSGAAINKIAGADAHGALLEALNRRGGRCFYLGASEATLAMIRARVAQEYPKIKVESYSPPFRRAGFNENDSSAMAYAVNAFAPDVLFVGMSAPKQELWVAACRDRLNAGIICSVGAVFDFYAGVKRRPPQWMIRMKLEWFGRLLLDTRNYWRRAVFSNSAFFISLCFTWLKQKF